MPERLRFPWAWLGAGLGLAVVLAAVGITLLTRTDPGRARILEYTLEVLGGRLNGELAVARLEGSVFTGARLYDLALIDPDGEPLVLADSAFIEYRLATFLGGDVVIQRLVVFDPEIVLRRLPGDTLWNYQEILVDTTRARAGPGRATLIEQLELIDAEVTVLLPWEPERDLPARERQRIAEVAVSDTSRLVVEEVPGGYVRTIAMAGVHAVVADLTVAPDERGGTYLVVEDASGLVYLWQGPPLRVTGLEGELSLRDGVLRYEAERVALSGSALASAGVIDVTGEEPRYDVVITGQEVEFSDLQWLYPPLPDEGALSGRLWLETRPEGLLLIARELRMVTPDTRLAGNVGIVLGDTLRVVEADLRAAPLDVRTVQQMLPAGVPIEGLRIGSVVIESPAS